jgi:hypothetical protein
MYCSEKFLAPIVTTGRPASCAGARPASAAHASPAATIPSPAQTSSGRRWASPRSASASAPSAASASPAAAMHPARTSAQFCVWSPAKIGSPRLAWPTVVASVAAPIVHTAAVRIPAITNGAASGASTKRSFCAGVIPTASAASSTPASIVCRAVTALRRIGSTA